VRETAVGLQIVGARYADARVLRAARAFETLPPTFLWPTLPRQT
jgi:Asp-tRNA(Asn)/Glu-tRNA(Gln) amidotransferase A subunit family amidase